MRLERTLSALVNQAYGLTPAEIDLMWKTAPPRMPILLPATWFLQGSRRPPAITKKTKQASICERRYSFALRLLAGWRLRPPGEVERVWHRGCLRGRAEGPKPKVQGLKSKGRKGLNPSKNHRRSIVTSRSQHAHNTLSLHHAHNTLTTPCQHRSNAGPGRTTQATRTRAGTGGVMRDA